MKSLVAADFSVQGTRQQLNVNGGGNRGFGKEEYEIIVSGFAIFFFGLVHKSATEVPESLIRNQNFSLLFQPYRTRTCILTICQVIHIHENNEKHWIWTGNEYTEEV